MVLGVSGWVANKFGMNESAIRILFVVGVFCFGVGIGLYLILWVLKLISK